MTRAVGREDRMRGEPTDDQPGSSAAESDAKKTSKRAEEQLRDGVKQTRQDLQKAQKTLSIEDILVWDEMGCVSGMSRTYGDALR